MLEVLIYVRACFWVAVEVRQRTKAVSGLVAALLALPLWWAVDGKLGLTLSGLWWFALWLTISSTLLLLVIAPFILWRRQNIVAGPSQTGAFPDCSILELFTYLGPDAKASKELWRAIGQDILDELTIGRLKCWGRPIPSDDDFPDNMTFRGSSLIPIPSEHWRGTNFTFRFDEADRYVPHTYPPFGADFPTYADLRINKSQATEIPWTRRKESSRDALVEALKPVRASTRA